MSKFSLVVLLLAICSTSHGAPLSPYDDIVAAAAAGDWDKVQSLLTQSFASNGWKDVSLGGVKSLKPPQGGHVYGESEYTFHSATDFDGQKTEQSGGHKVINDDGKIQEFDFKPNLSQDDLFKKLGFKPAFGQS